ncbi:MAG: tripartite tricarboxylate transporter TctB family protein [Gammaproteobacteria bacterium]|nr:tripartite tricarboxylate transporter TctB family protein [Gammaproteobacteria bacterium]
MKSRSRTLTGDPLLSSRNWGNVQNSDSRQEGCRVKESRLLGAAVVAIGTLALFVLIPVGIVSPSDVPALALAPEFWPLVIASIFTLMGILMTIAPGSTDRKTTEELRLVPTRLPRLSGFLAILFAFYFVVPYLGMILPAMAMIIGLCWFTGERRWPLLILVAVGIPLILAMFFLFVANIPIPLGIFEFIYS